MLWLTILSVHARQVRVYGYVVDEKNVGIELANVYLEDGVTGTTTNQNGYYSLSFDLQDTVYITYSMIGYMTLRQQFYTDRDVVNVNVELLTDAQWLEEVEVRGLARRTGQMDQVQGTLTRVMPDATGGSIESLLITFAGVNQNNELSTQYNVRGGNFDENSVYVNGIEIHRPLLLRSGQQEGLSFVNPEMVEKVDFSAGGFDARYGDKMASVLAIRYKRPERLESSISVSLLGANAYVGWGDSTRSQMHGIRYKTSRYMLGALPTKGNYQPNFIDYQTQMTWQLPTREPKTQNREPWQIKLLGNFSRNSYTFRPDSMSESFGTYLQPLNKTIWYEGQEKDLFITAFLALQAEGKQRIARGELLSLVTLSGYYTTERETYDIRSEYVLSEKDASGSSSAVSRPGESLDGQNTNSSVLGTGTYHEHARNNLEAGLATLAYEGAWKYGQSRLEWGVSGKLELISDRISEWEWRDSMGYSMPDDGHTMPLYYALKAQSKMTTGRLEAYAQETYKWITARGNILLTGGVRMNWSSFTNEVLVSPRANLTIIPGWKRDFTFRIATGLYYQAPFYKEYRRMTMDQGVARIQLNNQLRAQRSAQVVAGADYYFRAWGRPFRLTAEAYFKYIDRMESYSVDNVRVRYSGVNDARGYTAGLDLKFYGELVPGVDSWLSFSTMTSKMRMVDDPYNRGWFAQPQEQRWALTLFFQDYIPRFPQYRFHLKLLFADGLPFGYPRQENMRYLGHMPIYKRIDLGASRTFSAATDKFMRKPSAKHVAAWSIYFEVFNVVDWKNVNSYYWITATDGVRFASPNYLTGRMFNLRFTVDIK